MKKSIVYIALFIALGFMLYGFVSGCGQGIPDSDGQSNNGSIDGYVYDMAAYNAATNTFTATAGATVVGAAQTTTTDANGYYKLDNLPAGEIAVTVFKNGYVSSTLKVDKSRMNFLITPQSAYTTDRKGTATITGTITGLPAGATISGSAMSKRKYSSDWSFNTSTNTYTIANAPDDGEVYVMISYWTGIGGASYNSYGKVTVNPGETKTLNLQFGSFNTLSGSLLFPSGYTLNRNLNCYLYKGYQNMSFITITSLSTSAAFSISGLPALSSGDYYGLQVSASDSNSNYISKYYYNISGSTQDIDLSAISPPNPITPSPANNANLAGSLPTFAWDPVSGNNITYMITISETGTLSAKSIWSGITASNSISFPSQMIGSGTLVSGKTYMYRVWATSSSTVFNWADYPNLIINPPSDFYFNFQSFTARSFTF